MFNFLATRSSHKKSKDFKNTYKMSLNIFQFDINFFKYMFSYLHSHKLDQVKKSNDFQNTYEMSLKIFQFDRNFI